MTASYRDHMIMWAKDVGRSVDYLESRPDIAKDKIGYIGFSWGAELAPLIARGRAADLTRRDLSAAAFSLQPSLPEADPVNFAPRVKVPVLMLNGRYRLFLPDGELPGAAVQAPRHPCRTQTPRRLRDVTHDPAQRDDQGSGGLDGEVLGRYVALSATELTDCSAQA